MSLLSRTEQVPQAQDVSEIAVIPHTQLIDRVVNVHLMTQRLVQIDC